MTPRLCPNGGGGSCGRRMVATDVALAQKSGGILEVYHRDSPRSMSFLEGATNSAARRHRHKP